MCGYVGLTTSCVNVAVGHGVFLPIIGSAGVGFTYLVLKGDGQSVMWPRLHLLTAQRPAFHP
jgi:hypothetical protein